MLRRTVPTSQMTLRSHLRVTVPGVENKDVKVLIEYNLPETHEIRVGKCYKNSFGVDVFWTLQ